jgi:copper chaperone
MYELNVGGMSCGGCVKGVTRAVQAIDANAQVNVDLTQRKVRVQTAASLDSVVAAIANAGYPVIASERV